LSQCCFFYYYPSLTNLASAFLASTGYIRSFLNTVPELVALGGGGIIAGDDPGEEQQADEDEVPVFADDEAEAGAAPTVPVHNPPAAGGGRGDRQPAPELVGGPPDLDEELANAVAELSLDSSKKEAGEEEMKTIVKRIDYLPVAGAPMDVPTAIYAVLAILEPGTQLSTITASLCKNQKDGEVKAMLAPELNIAQQVIPHKKMMRQNPSIGQTLALALQEVLNQEETDENPFKPRPISKGSFRLDKRGDIRGIDGPVDPAHLGLVPDNSGDRFILHRVGMANTQGTVPCYVAIFFFLEERTQRVLHSPDFERKLPGYDRSPPSDGTGAAKRPRTFVPAAFSNLFTWST
jgi:hypothetical protein